ncbi:MAG TPA: F0F1 ATP synthase subunit delta, partial [Gammaproteobacteria bacterium]|nr:F0F1 ATP synthase subunit delta [Gammaproteobacteria bacterium]
ARSTRRSIETCSTGWPPSSERARERRKHMAKNSSDHGSVARPYARALFDVAKADGTLGEWSAALAAAADVVRDRAAVDYLGSPALDDAERLAFLESVLAEVPEASAFASTQGKALLELLIANDRLEALSEISAAFDELKAEAENRIKVKLVAACPVDSDIAGKIAAKLEQRLGRKVELECEVDHALIGGAIIQAEDKVIDGSVRARLARLTESLVG